MSVYHRIRDLREDRDLTQKEVADALYMHLTQYRRYETGERAIPLELAAQIAAFYGVSLDYLAGTAAPSAAAPQILNREENSLMNTFRQLTPINQGRLLERALTLLQDQ
ncbi:MAG: helix-turn-helix transcriptional regulator [Clostridia bacterium]|nr:helix-turn-helix transcriptional regulator [Clostridia bacterium]